MRFTVQILLSTSLLREGGDKIVLQEEKGGTAGEREGDLVLLWKGGREEGKMEGVGSQYLHSLLH